MSQAENVNPPIAVNLSQQQLIALNTILAKSIFSNPQHPVVKLFRPPQHGVSENGTLYQFEVVLPADPLDGMVLSERYQEYGLARFQEAADWARKRFLESAKVYVDTESNQDEEPYCVKIAVDLANPKSLTSLLDESLSLPLPPHYLQTR